MNIEYFKQNFIDYITNDDYSIKPSIELQNGEFWDKKRFAIVYDIEINNDTLILKATEEYSVTNIFKFEDFNIFNKIKNVVFQLNNIIIEKFEFVDVAWSDRVFVFETDFTEYNL